MRDSERERQGTDGAREMVGNFGSEYGVKGSERMGNEREEFRSWDREMEGARYIGKWRVEERWREGD